MRQIVLDTETTGLEPADGHRIIEIGAVRVTGLEPGETYETLIDAGVHIPPEISALTGITQDMVDQLQPGMTQAQVRYVMGNPLLVDVFHNQRWDYVYYLKVGRNDAVAKRWVSVFFEDDVVTDIRRDQELDPGL